VHTAVLEEKGEMAMRWIYYIPHTWHSPEERTTWEDVYLKLEEAGADVDSLWLTVDAGITDEHVEEVSAEWTARLAGSEHADRMGRWLRVGDREFIVTPDGDLWIRQEHFNLHELLDWVKVYLEEIFRDPDPVLIEGEFDEFAGTNQHARDVAAIGDALIAEHQGEDDPNDVN